MIKDTTIPSLDLQPKTKNAIFDKSIKKIISKERMSKRITIKQISVRRSATLRADGRYQVYAYEDGQRKSCYGRTEYKANCKADLCEADEEAYKILSDPNKRYIFESSFYRYRNFLLFYTSLERQTVDRYEATYNKYFPNRSFNQMDIRKLCGNDISEFLNSILDEYQKLTTKEYQRIKHLIKAVIDFVYDQELDESSDIEPVFDWQKIKRKIPKGKIYNKVKHEYAVSNADKMHLQNQVINKNIYPEKYAHVLMILINFSLGLRIGELAALQEDDVDTQRWVVYVRNSCKSCKDRDEYGNPIGGYVYSVGATKTPKGNREIPVSQAAQELFKILFRYRKEKGYRSKYLAYDGENLRARTREMAYTLQKLCDRSDHDYFNSHIIRKSFASNLSRCPDIDIATISEYMGHAQVSTTLNNYLIPAKESVEERIKQMSQFV